MNTSVFRDNVAELNPVPGAPTQRGPRKGPGFHSGPGKNFMPSGASTLSYHKGPRPLQERYLRSPRPAPPAPPPPRPATGASSGPAPARHGQLYSEPRPPRPRGHYLRAPPPAPPTGRYLRAPPQPRHGGPPPPGRSSNPQAPMATPSTCRCARRELARTPGSSRSSTSGRRGGTSPSAARCRVGRGRSTAGRGRLCRAELTLQCGLACRKIRLGLGSAKLQRAS